MLCKDHLIKVRLVLCKEKYCSTQCPEKKSAVTEKFADFHQLGYIG
jgi:hypothetical protein